MILDEPTVGQDELQKTVLLKFINQLHSNKKTVIVISHDIEFLWRLQPNIVTMSDGKIIEIGNSESIFKNQELMEQVGIIPPQIIKIFEGLRIKDEIPLSFEESCTVIKNLRN